MYVDAQLLFDEQSEHLTAGASTNVIDFNEARNMGVGQELYLVVVVTEAMTDAGSDSTMAVTVETDDNEGFSSATVAQTIGTFPATSAVGTRLVARLQPDKIDEQYARLAYAPANGDLSTGKFTAFITNTIDAYKSYADNITIS